MKVNGVEFEVRASVGGAKTMYQAWKDGKQIAGSYNKKYLKEAIIKNYFNQQPQK